MLLTNHRWCRSRGLEQPTAKAMATPSDTSTVFKTHWQVLELTHHQWVLDDIEKKLMVKDLHFEGMFTKELQTSNF